jgi:hypothetical protein
MQNKSVALPINNNRHSTHTLGKKEDKNQPIDTATRWENTRVATAAIYCLLSIATSLLPSECCWNVCVCAACFRFLFQLFSFFSFLLKLCCAGLCLAAVFVFLQLAGTLNGFLFFFFLFCQG